MDKEKLEQFNAFVQSLPITLVKNPYWAFDDDESKSLVIFKALICLTYPSGMNFYSM